MSRFPCFSMALSLAIVLAACSPSPQATPQQIAAANKAAVAAKAQQKLEMYRKLLAMKNFELAVPIGEEIVGSFPNTPAAVEVAKTLADIKARSAAAAEHARLHNLWLYQVAPQSGGVQSTAAIRPSQPTDSSIRLILRRHSAWGSSAYLYDAANKGFVCKALCDLDAHFDGKPRTFKGYLPPGGEPAIFIKDDKAFVAAMEKAQKITLEVVGKASGRQVLEFEVGGFDNALWKPLPKKK